MYIDAFTIAGIIADIAIMAFVLAKTIPGIEILRSNDSEINTQRKPSR